MHGTNDSKVTAKEFLIRIIEHIYRKGKDKEHGFAPNTGSVQ